MKIPYKIFSKEFVSLLLAKSIISSIAFLLCSSSVITAQTNPAITSWMINTTNIMGRHYAKGNSTPINDNVLANVQTVQYSATSVYISTKGIPAYITGPFSDGNPSIASNQNAIFKFPLNPIKNTGTATSTTPGNIGIFINGVALFDFRDAASWQNSSGSLKGGPFGGMGDGVWNRDAVVAERIGFDCAKAHPAMGNYHHHQNPSAFKLDLKVISDICEVYASDGLYAIDSTIHSPLLGFAYDGFPIYGAYAFKNIDGTGGIVRMKSSYGYRNITTRTTYANGSTVTAGPVVSTTYPLGYFREDYQYNATSPATPDYLDEHNGRFCVTPEYPTGIYCYFTTVDENWNSVYPYVVGPTFYGVKSASKTTSIVESVTNYTKSSVLTVSTNYLTINAPNNSTKTFEITSNTDWTVSNDQTWLTANKQSGNGNSTIILTAQENNSTTSRTAAVTVKGTGVTTQIIAVTQEGVSPLLTVSQSILTIAAPANSKITFDITSNVNWKIVSDQMWLIADKSDGNGNTTVTLTAQENTNTATRKAIITVSGIGVNSKDITVTQDGKGITLAVSNDTLIMASSLNSTRTFDITSNSSWTAKSSQTWLALNTVNGTGDATIILTAQANTDSISRLATVTVEATGVSSRIVSVTQKGQKITGISNNDKSDLNINIYPNPSSDLIAVQVNSVNYDNLEVELYDNTGKFIQKTTLYQGSTIAFFDTRTFYSGEYTIRISNSKGYISKKVVLLK
ncbi:MAG: YHYH protein [Bacteroidetes bacterium]|nr:YHYH protein [Bacteroidota bacterium]